MRANLRFCLGRYDIQFHWFPHIYSSSSAFELIHPYCHLAFVFFDQFLYEVRVHCILLWYSRPRDSINSDLDRIEVLDSLEAVGSSVATRDLWKRFYARWLPTRVWGKFYGRACVVALVFGDVILFILLFVAHYHQQISFASLDCLMATIYLGEIYSSVLDPAPPSFSSRWCSSDLYLVHRWFYNGPHKYHR